MLPSVESSTPPQPLPEDGIGDRLRTLRERHGLTQGDFAARTREHDPEQRGVSRTVLVGYESGKFKPGAREIRVICDAFGVTPHWLLYGAETDVTPAELTPELPDMVVVFTLALSLTALKPHERQAVSSLVHALSSARRGRKAQETLESLAWHMAVDAEERLHTLSRSQTPLAEAVARRGADLVDQLIPLYEAAHGANHKADAARFPKK